MRFVQRFFATEAASGIVLMFTTVLALAIANSPLQQYYHHFLNFPVGLNFGGLLSLEKPLELWINDGLMAFFFLLIGLEIKRELIEGELSTVDRAILPALAAAGGVVLPAVIYMLFNQDSGAGHGWAIPCATDIAFALGVLALFGSSVPVQLKIFLMAVAVIDDLIAVLIIAMFYTNDVDTGMLLYGFTVFVGLLAFNMMGVKRPALYIILGLILWVCILKSGVHATIAGVLLGLVIPLRVSTHHGEPLSRSMEHALHPWVAYGIIPIFAFANAGVSFAGLSVGSLLEPIPLGIAVGLFVGKQLGVFGTAYAAVKLGIASRPSGVGWPEFYATCILAGIGFTMSLFVGGLAFDTHEQMVATRVGVIVGSLFSAVVGYILLSMVIKQRFKT